MCGSFFGCSFFTGGVFWFLLDRRGSFGIGRGSYVALGLFPKLKLLIGHESREIFGVVCSMARFLRKLGHQSLVVGESYADTFDHGKVCAASKPALVMINPT